jgi:hypothetical protein
MREQVITRFSSGYHLQIRRCIGRHHLLIAVGINASVLIHSDCISKAKFAPPVLIHFHCRAASYLDVISRA